MSKSQGGKRKSGNRKHGRAAAKCARYRAAGTRERNRERRIRKHLRRHPNDLAAQTRLG